MAWPPIRATADLISSARRRLLSQRWAPPQSRAVGPSSSSGGEAGASDSRHRGASPPEKECFNSRTLSQKAVSFSSSSPPSSRTTASTDDSAPDRRRQLLPSAHQAALIGQGRADQRLKPAM